MSSEATATIVEFLKSARNLYRLIAAATLLSSLFAFTVRAPTDEESWHDAASGLISEHLSYVQSLHRQNFADVFWMSVNVKRGMHRSVDERVFAHVKGAIENQKWRCIDVTRIGDITVASPQLKNHPVVLQIESIEFIEDDRSTNFLKEVARLYSNLGVNNATHSYAVIPRDTRQCSMANRHREFKIMVLFAHDDFDSDSQEYPQSSLEGMSITIEPPTASTLESIVRATLVGHELEGRSFLEWLKTTHDDHDSFRVTEDGIRFIPGLEDEHTAIDILSLKRTLAIRRATAAFQRDSVVILGNSIPGSMLIYAFPLAVLVLLYNLFGHLVHLLRVVRSNDRSVVMRFPWIQMMPKPVGGARARKARWRALDAWAHLIIFPVVPLTAVVIRFSLWNTRLGWFLVGSGILILGLGISSCCAISKIRGKARV